jgi:hypothetical protein
MVSIDILTNCLAGKCPFPGPNGYHHERSINVRFQRRIFVLTQSQPVGLVIFLSGQIFVLMFCYSIGRH